MRATEARELFRQLTARYFAGATVTFSNQSRVAKPRVPLVTITPGIVRRPTAANYSMTDDEVVGHYLSRITFQVDLFTHCFPGFIIHHRRTVREQVHLEGDPG